MRGASRSVFVHASMVDLRACRLRRPCPRRRWSTMERAAAAKDRQRGKAWHL